MSTLSEYRGLAGRLAEAAAELSAAAAPLDAPPLAEWEWHRTLAGKLVPQLGANATLVVAVVGGTNIGKSVVFNHVCGEEVSSSAPTAAGTKHPTAAAPASLVGGGDDPAALVRMFPGFDVRAWQSEDDPLRADEADLLFWKVSQTVPENLVVLDTPDVDSTARVNWARADKVRRSADLLLAVITQQKYNDAAVREFFAKAADEGQVVAVVMNQVQLPDDAAYWPEWVGTFCEETGIDPQLVYLAPQDREAAKRLELPFLRRAWPPDPSADDDRPRDLLTEISELHFGDVKVQALRGALEQVAEGAADWLALLKQKSGELERAERRATPDEEGEWPPLPKSLVDGEVTDWWSAQRTGFAAGVDAVYGTLGEGLSKAWGGLRSFAGSPPEEPWEAYRRAEWERGVWPAVERSFASLERLADEGPPGVADRARAKLAEADRASLRSKLRAEHEAENLPRLLDAVAAEMLSGFREEDPGEYAKLAKVRNAVVLARPAVTTIGLAVGAGPALDFGAPFLIDAALGGAVGGAAGGAASRALTGGLSLYDRSVAAIPVEFAGRRLAWLRAWLRREFTGDLPDVLRQAATTDGPPAYETLRAAADELRAKLAA